MTIKDFVQNYNLHDSLLEKINYDKKSATVTLFIDFCYWQQSNYNDEMPETGNIIIQFSGCTLFHCRPYHVNSDEILKAVSNNDNELVLTVFNDLSGRYIDIRINASSVTFNAC